MAPRNRNPRKKNQSKLGNYSDEELVDNSVYDHLKTKNRSRFGKNESSSSKLLTFFLVGILIFGLLLATGAFKPDPISTDIDNNPQQNWIEYESNSDLIEVLIYSSPTCGCCPVYVDHLEENNYVVDFRKTDKMQDLKDDLQIPSDARSCHTSKLSNYFVEGHVPIRALTKLLEEKPDIDGISLPGMPPGSPGMPGEKSGVFVILSIANGTVLGSFVEI